MLLSISQIEEESKLADTLVAHLANLKLAEKQALLEETNPQVRLEEIYSYIQSEIEIMRVEKKIRARVKRPDGEEPKRVLFERADVCDTKRARRQGRW